MSLISRLGRKLSALFASEEANAAAPVPLVVLMQRLDADPRLRQRFLHEPRAVLREAGIDPSALGLKDKVSEAQIPAFLERARALSRPDFSPRPIPIAPQPPEPIPPPAPWPDIPRPEDDGASRRRRVPPREAPPEPDPHPSAPVYGPPPGGRW